MNVNVLLRLSWVVCLAILTACTTSRNTVRRLSPEIPLNQSRLVPVVAVLMDAKSVKIVNHVKLVPDDWLDLSQLVPFSPDRDYALKTGSVVGSQLRQQWGDLPKANRKSLRLVDCPEECARMDLVGVVLLDGCRPVVKGPRDAVEVEVTLKLEIHTPDGETSLTRRYVGKGSQAPKFGTSTIGTVLRVATLTATVTPEMAVLARRAHDEAVQNAMEALFKEGACGSAVRHGPGRPGAELRRRFPGMGEPARHAVERQEVWPDHFAR